MKIGSLEIPKFRKTDDRSFRTRCRRYLSFLIISRARDLREKNDDSRSPPCRSTTCAADSSWGRCDPRWCGQRRAWPRAWRHVRCGSRARGCRTERIRRCKRPVSSCRLYWSASGRRSRSSRRSTERTRKCKRPSRDRAANVGLVRPFQPYPATSLSSSSFLSPPEYVYVCMCVCVCVCVRSFVRKARHDEIYRLLIDTF